MTNLSYVCGVGTEPLLYKTVGAVLEDAAARWGEREALIVVLPSEEPRAGSRISDRGTAGRA